MKRDRSAFLVSWLQSKGRKPLVVRGARQTGKTWLVRNLAQSEKKELVELNFEKRLDYESLFSSNDPQEILMVIGASFGKKIDPTKTLLFLDEIQVVPKLLGKLRWFAEEMPELPIIAAGSLLDFALGEHEFSMPVGRISYMYLEPLSFEEFLEAIGKSELREFLRSCEWNKKIPEVIHQELIKRVKEYLVIGGMPAVVSAWADDKDLSLVNQTQFDLISTYRDDFGKYRGRLEVDRLEEVMTSIPHQLGQKFVYKTVNSEVSSPSLKQALSLLTKARVCHQVVRVAGNGLPLAAEENEKFFKVLFLDCGLCGASLGLTLHQINSVQDIIMINHGAVAEQLAGQLLRSLFPPYLSPSLYYWMREEKGSSAEIDYLIQHENQVIPVEVKAGTTGKLKSLHLFMESKKKSLAVRIYSGGLTRDPINISKIQYDLLSLPFYLIGQLPRLLTL
jgi:predicted AAA+ superfamily ATPase